MTEPISPQGWDRLTALRSKLFWLSQREPFHHPGCRKVMYDPSSSPCTCLLECSRELDDLLAASSPSPASPPAVAAPREQEQELDLTIPLTVRQCLEWAVECFKTFVVRGDLAPDDTRKVKRQIKLWEKALAQEQPGIAPQEPDGEKVLKEIGEWERNGGGWEVERMAAFIDQLIDYSIGVTHKLAPQSGIAPATGTRCPLCSCEDGLVQEWVSKARAVATSKGLLTSSPSGEREI